MNLKTGKDLCSWRKVNNLTQEELASRTGYSPSRIAHIESKNENISKKLKEAIYRLHRELHPREDNVLEAWKNLRSYGYQPIKNEIDKLAEILPELLTPETYQFSLTEEYFKLLARTLDGLRKIKNLNTSDNSEEIKNTLQPIVNEDIYHPALEYLNKKSEPHN